MSDDGLNYGLMMQRAFRAVMSDALGQVAKRGLPGDHHFYITFDTRHVETVMPDWLREQYPDEITIVLQHEFDDLTVDADGFSVRMSFSNRPTRIYVPLDAVMTFVDPSVEFGLKFDATEAPENDGETAAAGDATPSGADDDEPGTAEVVSLDQFRKN